MSHSSTTQCRSCSHLAGDEKRKEKEDNKHFILRLVTGSILFILALVLYELPLFKDSLPMFLEIVLYGVSYLLIGGPVVITAFRNISRGKYFDENFLMTVATFGAFAIQEFPEGVAVMLFYMIGEMFQDKAVSNSRRSIKQLMDIRSDHAHLRKGSTVTRVDPQKVKTGDVIIVKPGEKVPLDGEIIEGNSMVNTSAITGESLPREVKPGDQILSGMINKNGLLTIKVTKEYSQSTVAKILELVENASDKKAPTEKFVTKFARYYTPVVVYAAMALAFIPPLFVPGATFSDWIYRALIFLVISCPCALVISIPLGFFGGIGRASREGILVKGGNYLEVLNNLKTIVFDKTGTLTEGVFMVNKVVGSNGYTEEKILEMAAIAESQSNHPIARSILKAYKGDIDKNDINYYREVSGQGIKAHIGDKEILAGNHKLMEREDILYQPVEKTGTTVYIAVDGTYAGYITISDKIKEDSLIAIDKLRKTGIQELFLLTGDLKSTARNITENLGLDDFYAELLPDQKVEIVEKLLKTLPEKEKLAFVGDGINDAPVLARSDIGIAMGGLGSDAAIEAADVVLMTDKPANISTAIGIARKTKKIIWQNIVMALGIKGIVLLMGAFGIATMWGAVFADVGVALLAVLNSMRVIKI